MSVLVDVVVVGGISVMVDSAAIYLDDDVETR